MSSSSRDHSSLTHAQTKLMQDLRAKLEKKRYHDVIYRMGKSCWTWERPEGKALAFEAIDRLLAVDMTHSSKILLRHYERLGFGFKFSHVRMGRSEANIYIMSGQNVGDDYDLLAALYTVYWLDGEELSTRNWQTVYSTMPGVVAEMKEALYTSLLQLNEDVVREICDGDGECAACSRHKMKTRCVIT